MKQFGYGLLMLGLVLLPLTPVQAAPPSPQLQSLISAALPPFYQVIAAELKAGQVTVCLRAADLTQLAAAHGTELEQLIEQVRVALTPLAWQSLSVRLEDAQGVCRPASDLLPNSAATPLTVTDIILPQQAIPTQSLQGKTVYVSAGHGWQWGPDYNSAYATRWRTQRPAYQDMIEDHNNAEAVTQYLIRYLEQAGATVIPVRERDWSAWSGSADNDAGAPSYQENGSWYPGTRQGYRGGSYRFATTVTTTATATATWRLEVPAAGVYALYAWVYPGANRAADAHYTISTAAGPVSVTLDQRLRQPTWRYLGAFPFYAGPVTVTLSNLSASANRAVIADALRLGGGTFDDLSGIQTRATAAPAKPWWEVATFYYAQAMGMSPELWSYYNDVVSRPYFARWNHAGSGEDALYISWHTNGYNGTVRGTESYVHNGETYPRTPGSLELQQTVHGELIRDIRAGWDASWIDRGKKQANLGELRMLWDTDTANRMPGVLIELAYHDHPTDAQALKDPRFNQLAARAIYQGIVHYFETRDGIDLVELPEPPTHLQVRNLGDGVLQVSWRPSPTDTLGLRGDAASAYHLYVSEDGFAWSAPRLVTGTTALLTDLLPGEMRFVRVSAVNAGGESFPSEVLGARVGNTPPLLIVNGYDKLNAYGLVPETDPVEGFNLRMDVSRMNRGDYVLHHGLATPLAYAWDSASNEAVRDGDLTLNAYAMVDWILGRESLDENGTLDATERALLRAYLQNGGALLISGSEIAWDLEAYGRDPAFLNQDLHAAYLADDAGTRLSLSAASGPFQGLGELLFDAPGEYLVDSPDVLEPRNGAQTALLYAGVNQGAAAIAYASDCTHLIVMGFPFEALRPKVRPAVMARALDYLDACAPEPVPPTQGFLSPTPDGFYQAPPAVYGWSAGEVSQVEVQLCRADGACWDGQGWNFGEKWVRASGRFNWTYTLPTLADGEYAMRARAFGLVPALSDAAVSFTLDSTPPLAPLLAEPAANAWLTVTEVSLSWSAPPDGGSPLHYRLELDGQEQAYWPPTPGESAALPSVRVSVEPGWHTWRVRAGDAAGNLGPWSEERSFRVAPPPETTLLSPASGLYSTTLAFTGTASGAYIERVELQLQRADGAYWTGQDWTAGSTWISATLELLHVRQAPLAEWRWSYPALPLADGTYTLRARAWNGTYDPTPAEVSFTLDSTPPAAPQPLTPSAGTVLLATPVYFRWQAPPDEGTRLTYEIELAATRDTTADTAYSAELPAGSYTWRVRAVDAAGNVGAWSAAQRFTLATRRLYLPLALHQVGTPPPPPPPPAPWQTFFTDGFETLPGPWSYNRWARRVTSPVFAGQWAAQIGPEEPGEAGYASVSLALTLPADASALRLSYERLSNGSGDAGDWHYVSLRANNTTHTLLLLPGDQTATWTRTELDLSAYRGQAVTLYLGVYNDGDAARTRITLDEVRLDAYRP